MTFQIRRWGYPLLNLCLGGSDPWGGVPYSLPRAHPDAEEFFDGVEQMDHFALKILRQSLQAQERRANQRRLQSVFGFKVGEWVFVQRPTAFVGPKMQTSWLGPFQIAERSGEHSYKVHIAPRNDLEVHEDQIKRCVSYPELERSYPMVYRRGEPLISFPEANIKKILKVESREETIKLHVEWIEEVGGGQSWLEARQLSPAWSQLLQQAIAAERGRAPAR
jgi:hypothetical protein